MLTQPVGMLIVGLGLGISLLSGCGGKPPTHPVSGRVEFVDGTPVRFGLVELLSVEHRINARGTIQADGSFSVGTFTEDDGAVAGLHKVTISQMVMETPGVRVQHDHGELIHKKYFSYQSTDLEIQVEPGDNQVRLVVEFAD